MSAIAGRCGWLMAPYRWPAQTHQLKLAEVQGPPPHAHHQDFCTLDAHLLKHTLNTTQLFTHRLQYKYVQRRAFFRPPRRL